jgi:glycerol uptake facilitator protein
VSFQFWKVVPVVVLVRLQRKQAMFLLLDVRFFTIQARRMCNMILKRFQWPIQRWGCIRYDILLLIMVFAVSNRGNYCHPTSTWFVPFVDGLQQQQQHRCSLEWCTFTHGNVFSSRTSLDGYHHHPPTRQRLDNSFPHHRHPLKRRRCDDSAIFPKSLVLRGGGGDSGGGGDRSSITDTSSSHTRFSLWHEMLAEMVGTFIIVQFGTAAIMSAVFCHGGGISGLLAIAVVWSVAVTVAIATTAAISGAHLNPAISIAMAWIRPSTNFGWYKVLPYIVAQFIGAILGSCVNLLLFGSSIQQYEASHGIVRASLNAVTSAKAFGEYYSISIVRAFAVEAFGTAILSAVIFSLTHPRNDTTKQQFIPPLIGGTVGALICTFAPLTQAGFNPARDFGPRIVAYLAGWKSVAFLPIGSWFVYIVAPIVGAVLGASFVDGVLYRPKTFQFVTKLSS